MAGKHGSVLTTNASGLERSEVKRPSVGPLEQKVVS